MNFNPYSWLENPFVYRLSQWLTAPDAAFFIQAELKRLTHQIPAGKCLDVGCGPKSLLFGLGFQPVGLDLNERYVEAYRRTGAQAVVGSADHLPFPNATFDAVWSVGLLHHLPDAVAQAAVREIIRVCKPIGCRIILDAVMPRRAWTRPLAYIQRKMDRGSFMRTQKELEQILTAGGGGWSIRRFTYSLTGIEMVSCMNRESDHGHGDVESAARIVKS